MATTPHGNDAAASLDNAPKTRKQALLDMKTKHLLSRLDLYATIPQSYLQPAQDILDQLRTIDDAVILATGIEKKKDDPLQQRGDIIRDSLQPLKSGAGELQAMASSTIKLARNRQQELREYPPKNTYAAINLTLELAMVLESSLGSCLDIVRTLEKQCDTAAKTILTHQNAFSTETRAALFGCIETCGSRIRQIQGTTLTLQSEENAHRHASTEEEALLQYQNAGFVKRLQVSRTPTAEETARIEAIKRVYTKTAPQLAAQANAISELISGFRARTEGEGTTPEEERFLKAHRPSFISVLEGLSLAAVTFNSACGDMERRLSLSFSPPNLNHNDKNSALSMFHNVLHAKKEQISMEFSNTVRNFGYLRDKAPRSYFEAYSGFVDAFNRKLDTLDKTFGDMTKALETMPPFQSPSR